MDIIENLLAKASPQQEKRVHVRMMLAARIADALEAKGWSQKELAANMQKQPSEISKWLSGTHNFTIDTLSDLSYVLDVQLLCIKEEEPKTIVKHMVKYQTLVVAVPSHPAGVPAVSFTHFQNSIGQSVTKQHHEA